MRFYFSLVLFFALLISACSGSRPTISTTTSPEGPVAAAAASHRWQPEEVLPVDPKIRIGKLDNGLRYYIRKNVKPENRAELRLVVNAGSILEDDDQQGLAHFVEHMAFNGTEKFAKQELVNYLESIGMRFGPDLNAYTSFDETVYMLQIPTDSSAIVQTGFDILSEWAHFLSFDSTEIEKERGVVIEEWRLGQGAQARMRDKQFPILFKGSRYAERLPIGRKAVLDTFHHESLKRFYQKWYRPELMAVVAVGDFDPGQIEDQIKTHFKEIPASRTAVERPLYPVPDHSETLFTIVADPEATRSSVAVYTKQDVEPEGTAGDYRRSLVEGLFHSMFNARLDELRQQPQPPFLFGYSGKSRFVRTKSFYTLGAAVENTKLLTGLEALLTEAERVKQFGFSESELNRQKADMLRSIELAYNERDKSNSRGYAAEYIRNFLTNEPIPGIEVEYQLYRQFVPEISLEEINRLAGDWLKDQNRVIAVNMPEREDLPVPTEAELLSVFRKVESLTLTPYRDDVSEEALLPELPAPGTIVAEKTIPEIDVVEWRLSNGVRVVFKSTDFKNDQVIMSAFSPGGHSLAADQDFIPAITATSVVTQGGVGNLNRIQLEKKLAGKAVNISPSISELAEGFRGSASPKDLETLFQLTYLYFTAPRKDSSAFLSYRQRLQGYLENRNADPESAFEDTLQVTLSQHHFRARPWSAEVLKELDLERSYQFYRDRFADAGDFTFFFVGNIDPDSLRKFSRRYLASLPAHSRRENWRDVGITPPQGVIKKTVRKGLEPKSRVSIVFTGPYQWSRENNYLLRSMASVLRIKLREQLREDKGGTYGVGVSASPSHYPRQEYEISIGFGCAPDRVEELIKATFLQIDSLRQFDPDEKVLQKVRETQRRSYELNLKRNGYWLRLLRRAYFHHSDPTNVLHFPELMETLQAGAIRETAERYLNHNNYVQVVLLPEE